MFFLRFCSTDSEVFFPTQFGVGEKDNNSGTIFKKISFSQDLNWVQV